MLKDIIGHVGDDEICKSKHTVPPSPLSSQTSFTFDITFDITLEEKFGIGVGSQDTVLEVKLLVHSYIYAYIKGVRT
jgi:hypothetical protein